MNGGHTVVDRTENYSHHTGRSECIVVVGKTNSGKTTVGQIAEEEFELTHVEASEQLRRELAEAGEMMNERNIRQLLSDTDGLAVAQRVADIVERTSDPAVVTGFRKPAEVDYLQDRTESVTVGKVTAPRRERLRRMNRQNGSTTVLGIEGFQTKEALDEELGLERLLSEYPDFEIDNSGGMEQLRNEVTNSISLALSPGVSPSRAGRPESVKR